MPWPTHAPEPGRGRRCTAAVPAVLAVLLALAGCAKKGPPSGGPPDIEPPRVVATVPDSGAAKVSTHPRVSVTFSERMEPRSSGAALEFAPPLAILQRRWSGNTLTLVLKDSLRIDHTYTLFVGAGARDLHGNPLMDARAVVFTTAETFPPGVLAGRVEAVGFQAGSTSLWCYRDGRQPDSTARDFDALGVADGKGNFRIAGLAPGLWRVYGFADLNHNRSFEPASDLLVAADTTLALTPEHPVAADVRLRMVNPRAPGRFAGTVLDTVSDHSGVVRLIVTSLADTTRRLAYEVPESGSFDFQWDPAIYRVRAYRDLDTNKAWKRDTEPASAEIVVTLGPGAEITGVSFVLERPGRVSAGP
jgi:predicted small lipoprotein YifL